MAVKTHKSKIAARDRKAIENHFNDLPKGDQEILKRQTETIMAVFRGVGEGSAKELLYKVGVFLNKNTVDDQPTSTPMGKIRIAWLKHEAEKRAKYGRNT